MSNSIIIKFMQHFQNLYIIQIASFHVTFSFRKQYFTLKNLTHFRCTFNSKLSSYHIEIFTIDKKFH